VHARGPETTRAMSTRYQLHAHCALVRGLEAVFDGEMATPPDFSGLPSGDELAAELVFCGHVARGEAPTIYGDGKQTRDYIYIADLVDAFLCPRRVPRQRRPGDRRRREAEPEAVPGGADHDRAGALVRVRADAAGPQLEGAELLHHPGYDAHLSVDLAETA
jgi:hypothetical protein